MATLYTLDVRVGGTTYSYGADLESVSAATEKADADSIDMGSAKVQIDGSFLGQVRLGDLPTDAHWRARLLCDGTEIVNGVIERVGGVRHTAATSRWTVTVVDYAPKDLLARLDAVAVGDITVPDMLPTYPDVQVPVRAVSSVNGNTQVGMLRLADLWAYVRGQVAGVTWQNAEALLPFSVHYINDDQNDQTITRNADLVILSIPQLESVGRQTPAITALQLLEELQILLGWRVRVRYTSFPSDDIEVVVQTDAWPVIGGLPDLDGRIEGGGYSERYRAATYPDLAISFLNADPNESSQFTYGADDATPRLLRWRYAANQALFDKTGKPTNRNTLALMWTLPQWMTQEEDNSTTPDATNHPDYQERLRLGTLAYHEDAQSLDVLLAAVAPDPSSGTGEYLLVLDRALETLEQPGQEVIILESSAEAVLSRYDVSARDTHVVQGSFDVAGLSLTVGDPNEGVRLDGDQFLVEKRVFRADDGSAKLDLVRPL